MPSISSALLIHLVLDWLSPNATMRPNGEAVSYTHLVSIAMEEAGFKDRFREMNPNPVANLSATLLQIGHRMGVHQMCIRDRRFGQE